MVVRLALKGQEADNAAQMKIRLAARLLQLI